MELTLDQVRTIYRQAIDPKAKDAEGSDWWDSVSANVLDVTTAPTIAEAAKAIEWWRSAWEWKQFGDSAKAAARRIRQAARSIGVRVGKASR